jgi:putative ABC transport system permease protein
MIKNYFKTAIRNLLKRKGYTALNIAGLAIGIAACLLLFLVVRYELSYDKFQPGYKNIGRVVTEDKFSDGITYNSGIPVPALDALRLEMPNTAFTGLLSSFGSQVTVGSPTDNTFTDRKFIEETGIFFIEPQFFQVFSYKWLTGNATVLDKPNTAVLTKKMAQKYFGTWQQAIDRYIKLDNAVTLKIEGILDDAPGNTDFPLGVQASLATLKSNAYHYNYYPSWNSTSSNFQIYAALPGNAAVKNIDQQLAAFSKKHYTGLGNSVKTNFIQPLSEIHFDKRFEIYGDHVTSKSSLWTLSLIGIFIIIMACINFINLSTAQAVGRSKEVGIRKVLGSSRRQLFFQVMSETAIVVTVAGILAMGIAIVCLPFIKHIASIQEQLSLFTLQTVCFVLLVIIAVTALAGLYPSLVMSGFKPITALKNKFTSAKVGGISLRRGLVVTQFAISQVLIIGTIVAISQMNFVNHADLGFEKEAVLTLSGNADSVNILKLAAFKAKLLQTPGVQAVSFSSDAPSSGNTSSTNFAFDHKDDEKFQLTMKFADEDYFKTYGLQLKAGRVYGQSDTIREVVINETLADKLGIKNAQDAVGKELRLGRSGWKTIVGVVKDFKTNSLRENIKPLMIAERKDYYSFISLKLRSSNIPQTQTAIQTAWNEFFPDYAYSSKFMDDSINEFYKQEQQLSLLYKIFAFLAIVISSLGLYGLVSFMAVQKTKEVGIRKTLGASTANIVYLFSKEFTILIGIAFFIAAPVAFFMMRSWLQDFVYRVKLGAGVFILAIIVSIVIAWITVGYKAIKAAVANPVKSLRTE